MHSGQSCRGFFLGRKNAPDLSEKAKTVPLHSGLVTVGPAGRKEARSPPVPRDAIRQRTSPDSDDPRSWPRVGGLCHASHVTGDFPPTGETSDVYRSSGSG